MKKENVLDDSLNLIHLRNKVILVWRFIKRSKHFWNLLLLDKWRLNLFKKNYQLINLSAFRSFFFSALGNSHNLYILESIL